MKLVVDKEKLIFYQNLYTVTVYKQDIKKIAIFWRDYKELPPQGPDLINTGYVEIADEILAKKTKVGNEYSVILKIITDKKEINSKNIFLAKIIDWITRIFSISNPVIATSGNYNDSTSIMGRENILQALNDLKNNDYAIDHLFNIFHALLDQPTVGENLENSIKKNAKKIILLFWVLILGLLILVASLYLL